LNCSLATISGDCPNDQNAKRFDSMTDREKKLLVALVKMVDQYLDRYEDEVDSHSMSAGEHAIMALADFGLMVDVNTRFGRWTEAGKKFVAETK
jgi:hypothetical protein